MYENPTTGPQTRSRAILIVVLAFLGGLVVGLPILGWWIWPVQWTDIPQPPTYTPYPTFMPFPTPTSGPDAYVMNNVLNLYESPGYEYAMVGQVNPKDPLTLIGQYANCGWLKVTTPSQLTGWVDGSGLNILQLKPCENIPAGTFRPLTSILKSPANPGQGLFTIDSTNPDSTVDRVILLVDQAGSAETIAAAYVRHGETITITGIPDGKYSVYEEAGSEWNDETQHFMVGEILVMSSDPMEFITTSSQYTVWTLTFTSILGGNTNFINVLPGFFPEINK
jgi:hypothetical protein